MRTMRFVLLNGFLERLFKAAGGVGGKVQGHGQGETVEGEEG